MMNKISFSGLVTAGVIFMGHTFKIFNFYQALLFVFLSILIVYIKQEKLKIPYIYGKDKLNLTFIYFLFFSSLYSINQVNSLKYIYMYTFITFIGILVSNLNFSKKISFYNLIFIFSGVNVLFTWLQFLNADFILAINQFLLNDVDLQNNTSLLLIDSYSGITGQTAINAYFISVFIACLFSKIIASTNQNKFWIVNILMLFMSFFALFITNKRSFLIINVISILIIWLIFIFKKRTKSNKKLLVPVFVLFAFFIIKDYLPENNNIIMKFKILSDSNDFSNGREYLWNGTLDIFQESPYFGIGINTIGNKLDDLTHNIYIQLLAEIGIFGLLIFLVCIIFNLFLVLKKIFKILYKTKNIFVNEKILETNLFSLYMQILFILYGFSGNPLYSINFLLIYTISVSITTTTNKINIEDDPNEKSRHINIS